MRNGTGSWPIPFPQAVLQSFSDLILALPVRSVSFSAHVFLRGLRRDDG